MRGYRLKKEAQKKAQIGHWRMLKTVDGLTQIVIRYKERNRISL